MYSWKTLLFCVFFANLLLHYEKKSDAQGLTQFYEYGAHVDGDKLSFKSQGVIAEFIIQVNITLNTKVKGLESSFTYIRVNYDNYLSGVSIKFDPKTNVMHFMILLPFFKTQYQIIGYSMPIRSHSHMARIGEEVISELVSNIKGMSEAVKNQFNKAFG